MIAIEAHDYPGGVVAFTTTSPITLIDSPVLSASVSVGRSVALVAANVTWTAVYPVGTSGQSLSNLLVATTGTVSFQVDQTSSQFILTLNTNQVHSLIVCISNFIPHLPISFSCICDCFIFLSNVLLSSFLSSIVLSLSPSSSTYSFPSSSPSSPSSPSSSILTSSPSLDCRSLWVGCSS